MKKNLQYYLSLHYPIQVEQMEDGIYCASIPLLKGCKGYADTAADAIAELQGVKQTLIEMMVAQGKSIPEPTVRLEIPISAYTRLRNRRSLDRFVKSTI